MNEDMHNIQKQIDALEAEMLTPDFWADKTRAQSVIKEIAELKDKKEGLGKYDKGNAILTIISGAGGDDAEDFTAILLSMYEKYAKKNNFDVVLIDDHKNDHGGYRNVTIKISGKGVYGNLKNESGVHRLVRISPFNAKKLRHTSFSLVEVLPEFGKLEEHNVAISPEDLKIEFSRSSGPGGQNVNKRETAVRIVHIPTGIAVSASTERSQEKNREQALGILRAKIFKAAEKEKKSIEEIFKNYKKEIEWGSQIRSYVLHPYKMVKDHRTGVETANIDAVLDGELTDFIVAEKKL